MSVPNDIVFYHYPYSPFARRVLWYLQLRGIPYAQCLQPPVLPRPDVNAIGVNYRRIPLMAIGRDIYLDTRLILQKLEQRFPDGALGAQNNEKKALERLLEKWMVEGMIFARSASLLPTDLPAMKDPKFQKDREALSGRSWKKETLDRGRPESEAHIRNAFEFLETTLLADGRDWVLKTDKPSLADIEAIWSFDWLIGMNAVPASWKQQFPKLYAWIARFKGALNDSKATAPKPVTIKGPDAAKFVNSASFAEPEGDVDSNDPLALTKGAEIELWPIDSGFSHHDRGKLIKLTTTEVTISTQTKEGQEVRIHAPRVGFRIAKTAGAKL